MDAGADINAEDADGKSPLSIANNYSRVEKYFNDLK